MKEGSGKIILVGVGAILAFTQFGPLGIIILGVLLMLIDK